MQEALWDFCILLSSVWEVYDATFSCCNYLCWAQKNRQIVQGTAAIVHYILSRWLGTIPTWGRWTSAFSCQLFWRLTSKVDVFLTRDWVDSFSPAFQVPVVPRGASVVGALTTIARNIISAGSTRTGYFFADSHPYEDKPSSLKVLSLAELCCGRVWKGRNLDPESP